MHILPFIVIGGALLAFGKKKKRRAPSKVAPEPKAIPVDTSRGEVFEADGPDRPNIIRVKPGERFSLRFATKNASPEKWSFKAAPPDGSILLSRLEHDKISQVQPDDPDGEDVYVFDAVKVGTGSLVFHWRDPMLDGEAPPTDLVEILTEVSS